MESDRAPAIRFTLPRIPFAIGLIGLVLLNAPQAAARPAEGHRGDDTTGWADPNGYHVRAKQPGARHARSAGERGQDRSADQGSSGTSTPTYCKAAAVGVRIADPIAAMGGTPVDCTPGQNARPTVTPQELAQQAWGTLRLPLPDVRTAPPRGTQGLVGLAEWVWVSGAQWRPLAKTASAGGVWARVTATPKQLTIAPGAGLPAVRCDGPGTAYNPSRPASAQRTNCSYTYLRSSKGQPHGAYQMTVTVVWSGAWIGSGGTGGGLPEISRSTTFGVRVAEGQGLYG